MNFLVKLVFILLVCQAFSRFTSGYSIQSNFLFDQVFLSKSDHLLKSIGNLEGLLDHLVGPRLSRSSTLYGASQIRYYIIQVCFRVIKLEERDHVVSFAATITLQQQKIEVEVYAKEAEPCCIQLAMLFAIAIALSRLANFMQQSG